VEPMHFPLSKINNENVLFDDEQEEFGTLEWEIVKQNCNFTEDNYLIIPNDSNK
jgi:hypothetical protein